MRLPAEPLRRTALALVVVTLTACATHPAGDARRSVVAAERAFASMSAERGIRAAFLASFADDGIGFDPAPMVLKEKWSARPAPANPTERTLAWHPVIAGVARSGDARLHRRPVALRRHVRQAAVVGRRLLLGVAPRRRRHLEGRGGCRHRDARRSERRRLRQGSGRAGFAGRHRAARVARRRRRAGLGRGHDVRIYACR